MAERKKVLISGLPGNMATNVAALVQTSEDFELLDFAFTGAGVEKPPVNINGKSITLVKPHEREKYVNKLNGALAVDYSTPASYVDNCMFFIRHNVPFVIGTTGAAKEDIVNIASEIKSSNISAVIDQNMSVELVLIGAALDHLAKNFPNALKNHAGYGFESHQAGKKDKISGTLIKWGDLIRRLGVNFYTAEGDRTSAYGHAYHSLSIVNDKGNVRMNIRTEVEGRDAYAQGTIVALRYLASRMKAEKGKVYSMIDVLRAA